MARRDELLNAAGWAAAGALILAASWRMDRLESRGINPWSVPGLTPGLVGAAMIGLALLLALSARRKSREETTEAALATKPGDWGHTLIALALCLLFGGVTLGSGLPFVAQAAVFIFAFTTIFGWSTWRAAGRVGRGLLQSALVAVIASALIAWLFESVFLVRLP